MKKEPTLEEWKEIGAKAKDVRDNLNELLELLSGKLPLYQYENKWDNAEKAFGKLRSHLDNLVLDRFPRWRGFFNPCPVHFGRRRRL